MRRRRYRKRFKPDRPSFSIEEILRWADEWHERTGEWPNVGKRCWHQCVPGSLWDTWRTVSSTLRTGGRGLPGGSSLAQLLTEHRGVRNRNYPPPLTEEQILGWADRHLQRTGQWPNYASGPVLDAPGESWIALDSKLRVGGRSLPGGSSLARLLDEQRGVRNNLNLPDYSLPEILGWADAHRQRTGKWPCSNSGVIGAAPEETWRRVDQALRAGNRGLPGGSSLAELLERNRKVRHIGQLPPYTIAQILAWADSHFGRTGRWPISRSGPIADAPGETWQAVNSALQRGYRGLPGGSSLHRVLVTHGRIKE